jgi:exodeoxyribonuclease VII small subunit
MNKKTNIPGDIKTLKFEEALSELEDMVEKLQQGDIDLEDLISIYQRCVFLKEHCAKKLKSAEMEISKIVSLPDGDFSLEPLDEK